jgi:hypothetical protein
MRSCERAVHQPVSRSSGLPTDTAACRGRIAQPVESVIPAESSCWTGGWRAHQVSVAGRRGPFRGWGLAWSLHGGPPRTASRALAGARVAPRWPSAPLDPTRGPRPGGGADQPAPHQEERHERRHRHLQEPDLHADRHASGGRLLLGRLPLGSDRLLGAWLQVSGCRRRGQPVQPLRAVHLGRRCWPLPGLRQRS